MKGGPERDLLRVLVHEPSWRPTIREHLERMGIDETADTRLVRRLAASEPEVPAATLLEETDDTGRSLLTQVMGERWGPHNVDAIVDGALRKIESRKLETQLRAIDRQLPVASDEEKTELAAELHRLLSA